MANNTVSFKLKIVDEATGSIKKVTASTNELRGIVQKVTDEVVTSIAKMQPTYAVLRDTSLADDATATNFEQIFKTYAPNTTTKIL